MGLDKEKSGRSGVVLKGNRQGSKGHGQKGRVTERVRTRTCDFPLRRIATKTDGVTRRDLTIPVFSKGVMTNPRVRGWYFMGGN